MGSELEEGLRLHATPRVLNPSVYKVLCGSQRQDLSVITVGMRVGHTKQSQLAALLNTVFPNKRN